MTTCPACALWGGRCPACLWAAEPALAAQEAREGANACAAELLRRRADPAWLAGRRLAMAVDLALDLETCRALLLGERVAPRLLAAEAVQRYGLRL